PSDAPASTGRVLPYATHLPSSISTTSSPSQLGIQRYTARPPRHPNGPTPHNGLSHDPNRRSALPCFPIRPAAPPKTREAGHDDGEAGTIVLAGAGAAVSQLRSGLHSPALREERQRQAHPDTRACSLFPVPITRARR
ncbi:hypothetical protein V495_07987, partial [Pseudogymnoascus sp. VKM F-4514 (FW-929)]